MNKEKEEERGYFLGVLGGLQIVCLCCRHFGPPFSFQGNKKTHSRCVHYLHLHVYMALFCPSSFGCNGHFTREESHLSADWVTPAMNVPMFDSWRRQSSSIRRARNPRWALS